MSFAGSLVESFGDGIAFLLAARALRIPEIEILARFAGRLGPVGKLLGPRERT